MGYCCFNRSSSISVSGVLLVMERAWAQELLLYRASCCAHYYPDLLKNKASHESVVSSLTEEMQLIPSPPWKSTKTFMQQKRQPEKKLVESQQTGLPDSVSGFQFSSSLEMLFDMELLFGLKFPIS